MSVCAALEAHSQFAERSQPGMSTLDDPAVPTKAVVAVDAPTRNPILDASRPEMLTAARKVVALVRVQPLGAAPGSASATRDCRQRIYQPLEDDRVVSFGAGHAEHQRDALPIRDEVGFATEFAAIRRVRAGE